MITVTTLSSSTYYTEISFYAGNDNMEAQDINGNGFYAKVYNYTSTWVRSTSTNSDPPNYSTTGVLYFGNRVYPLSTAQYFTGFMHGYFHSIKFFN
jgi:hypothetical protein